MARHEQSFTGERLTDFIGFQVTPSFRRELEAEAEEAGARLSQYVRELCRRRSAGGAVVAGTRRNPDAKALMTQLSAIGNLLNQLARHANTTGEMPEAAELRFALDAVKTAMARVIAL